MRQSSISFLIVAACIWLARPAKAQSSNELDTWFAHAAAVNRPSLSEPAGSHGAQGLAIGTGISLYRAKQTSAIANQEFAAAESQQTDMQRLWLTKGLPWPVDLLFTGGQVAKQSFTQATSAIQWNFFENLALPTLALRASAGGLFGCNATEARTLGFELASSFSPLPYLTLFAALGSYTHSITVHVRDEALRAYFLDYGEASRDLHRSWRATNHSFGLRLLVLPPFVSTGAELLYEGGRIAGGSFKLSFGI